MTKHIKIMTCVLSLGLIGHPAIATAQDATIIPVSAPVQDNGQERINFSGKLRMLSQRIPAAACHLNSGVDTDGSAALLAASVNEFETILNALEFGDENLNIRHAEERRKTLEQIAVLRAEWQPFQAAANAIIAGDGSQTDLDYLMSANGPLLTQAQFLVEEISKEYTNPNAMTRASAMLVDISGRQRMLLQKISNETCALAVNPDSEELRSALETTVQVFEASLEALRFGMPSAGIGAPPNSQISDGLQGVLESWEQVEPAIERVIAGEPLSDQAAVAKFKGLNSTMADMNTVVGMYVTATKPTQ